MLKIGDTIYFLLVSCNIKRIIELTLVEITKYEHEGEAENRYSGKYVFLKEKNKYIEYIDVIHTYLDYEVYVFRDKYRAEEELARYSEN